jgi:glucosamine-6-phosphate deaminase
MKTYILGTKEEMGAAAADSGADAIRKAIEARGHASIILATGASQFEMLENLVKAEGIAWNKVTAFHLDEYIGLPETHPASFRRYLKERFAERVPNLGRFVYIAGDSPDIEAERQRIGSLITDHPIDVAFVGIGENGHLAFNDPPADFETEEPYLVVTLDTACRKQQLGEGWFESLDDVPRQAVSMGIRQIMKSRTLIVTVPDTRKAQAVKCSLEGEVSNMCPASIIRRHPDCRVFLDPDSASGLERIGR